MPKGVRLDMNVANHETDIKTTIGRTWMIPPEAVDYPCILVKFTEAARTFDIGTIIASRDKPHERNEPRHQALDISLRHTEHSLDHSRGKVATMNRHERRAEKANLRRAIRRKASPRGGMEMTLVWYENAEEFEKAQKLDPEAYKGRTYEEMCVDYEQICERVPTAVKVPIRVDHYAAWCQENNERLGSDSRIKYINLLYSGELS
jgi:hypothetical protein